MKITAYAVVDKRGRIVNENGRRPKMKDGLAIALSFRAFGPREDRDELAERGLHVAHVEVTVLPLKVV